MSAMAKRSMRLDGEETPLWPIPDKTSADLPPDDWESWLRKLFPRYVRGGFAPRHELFWDWLWAIEPDSFPDPFVGIWARGGSKSTSAELGCTALGVRGGRRYAVYVRGTQARADESVSNIGTMLESGSVQRYFPEHASRAVGLYGNVKGWRRNRLRTAGGFTIDALGLDTASRGVKVDDQRPDIIVFDDIDERHDTKEATEKKLTTIKESILPAGTANVAVIAIQNLIIPRGVFARLVDGSADMLLNRVLSGPEPALLGMKTEPAVLPNGNPYRRITAGTPTWEGQGIRECQQLMITIGFSSFDREAQHNVANREGALWTQELINETRVSNRPLRFKRVVVGVDPSGGAVEIGLIAVALGYDGHGYVLKDSTQKGALGPRNWGSKAVDTYEAEKADLIVAEGNFGGDMVKSNILVSNPRVPVRLVHASRGKDVRAQPIASLYEEGKIHHVGTFPELEAELTGWVPGDPESPNRLDALVWACTELFVRHSAEEDESSSSAAMRTFR